MKRNENESFSDYKKRRKQAKQELKRKLQPRWFWKSKRILTIDESATFASRGHLPPDFQSGNNGTYRKK